MAGDIARALEGAERARERMAALAERLAAVVVQHDEVFSGSDPTGTVQVDIDATGAVIAVRLEAAWRHDVGQRGIGAAILNARRAASMRSLERQANALRDAAAGSARIPVPAPESEPLRVEAVASRPTPDEILEILRDYREEAPAMRAASDAMRTTRREIVDVEGWATATVTGAEVADVDFDTDRLRHAPDREVEKVAVRLFAAAGASLQALKEQLEQDFPASARLTAASQAIAVRGV